MRGISCDFQMEKWCQHYLNLRKESVIVSVNFSESKNDDVLMMIPWKICIFIDFNCTFTTGMCIFIKKRPHVLNKCLGTDYVIFFFLKCICISHNNMLFKIKFQQRSKFTYTDFKWQKNIILALSSRSYFLKTSFHRYLVFELSQFLTHLL